MFTFNTLLNELCEENKLYCAGEHYRDGVPVYVGDLWRLFSNDLDSKRKDRFEALAEKKGIQVRFEDEIISDDNGKAHESNPGYHGQIATYKVIGCTVWSQDEALTHTDSYVEALLGTGRATSDRWLSDEQWEEQGFKRFDYDAESGFHPGQDDSPDSVAALFAAANPGKFDILFQIDDVGQFDTGFSLRYRKQEDEE